MNMMKKTLIASGVALALGAPVANAALLQDIFVGAPGGPTVPSTFSTDSANFTMLDGSGFSGTGGTNDVVMNWDGNAYSASSDYTGVGSGSNITASSTTLFKGHLWTAHDIQVFVPGTYSFDATLNGGAAEVGNLNVTVGANQIGMHMLFDWNGNANIDVFVVAQSGTTFGTGVTRKSGGKTPTSSSSFACDVSVTNCLWDGKGFGSAGKPAANTVWMLATVDGNGDGIMGIPMPTGGPFAGFNAGFNASMASTPKPSTVPVPAAVWLFGSGLLGLVGVASRKKDA